MKRNKLNRKIKKYIKRLIKNIHTLKTANKVLRIKE